MLLVIITGLKRVCVSMSNENLQRRVTPFGDYISFAYKFLVYHPKNSEMYFACENCRINYYTPVDAPVEAFTNILFSSGTTGKLCHLAPRVLLMLNLLVHLCWWDTGVAIKLCMETHFTLVYAISDWIYWTGREPSFSDSWITYFCITSFWNFLCVLKFNEDHAVKSEL